MSLIPYQTYKPINLQWLERVPEHWELKALKHCIARLGSGGTPESGNPDYWADKEDEEGIPWVSIGDMTTKPIVTSTQKRITRSGLASKGLEIYPVGSLLYSIYASLGKVATLGIDATFNQAILAIVPDETTVSQSYLCYWLKSLEAHLAYYASSNTQANLNAAKVLSYPVALPSQEEQLAIATFLDRETAKIDALIAEQQRLIELLQEKRQAVISHAVTKGLNPNAPMKDSGVEWLGEVPEHWEVLELKRLNMEGSSITYGIVQAGPHQENGVPYIRTSDMSGDRLLLETCQRTSPEIDEAYARSKVSEGDLVIAIRATVGKTLEVPKELDGANLTQGTAKFSPGERVTSGFMKLAFASSYSQAQIASIAKGATFLEITLDALRRLAFAVPPKDEARQITHYLSERCAVINTLTTNSEEACSLLKERRSALISAAVTGQIDVRGLAAEVAA